MVVSWKTCVIAPSILMNYTAAALPSVINRVTCLDFVSESSGLSDAGSPVEQVIDSYKHFTRTARQSIFSVLSRCYMWLEDILI